MVGGTRFNRTEVDKLWDDFFLFILPCVIFIFLYFIFLGNFVV